MSTIYVEYLAGSEVASQKVELVSAVSVEGGLLTLHGQTEDGKTPVLACFWAPIRFWQEMGEVSQRQDESIDLLKLSVRVSNALKASRINTIGDVARLKGVDGLTRISGLGLKQAQEVWARYLAYLEENAYEQH